MDELGLAKKDVEAWMRCLKILRKKLWETKRQSKGKRYDIICTGDTDRGLCCHRFNNLPRVMVEAEAAGCYPADSEQSLQETESETVEEEMVLKNIKRDHSFPTSCLSSYFLLFLHYSCLQACVVLCLWKLR